MAGGVDLNQNILKLDCSKYSTLCHALDQSSAWREILTHIPLFYRIDQYEIEQCANELFGGRSPSEKLLRKLADKNMTLQELMHCLEAMRLERALLVIKPQEPLKVIHEPKSRVEVDEGGELLLECEAAGFPYPHYCWFHGENQVHAGLDGKLIKNPVSINHAGSYICRIHNKCSNPDTVKWTTWVDVQVRNAGVIQGAGLQIVIQPVARLIVKILSDLTLNCEASGNLSPSYQWYKDDKAIHGGDKPCLKVERAMPHDEGNYHCKVWTKEAILKSTVSQVHVTDFTDVDVRIPVILEFLRQPTYQENSIGGEVVFCVEMQGGDLFTYQWFHNHHPVAGAVARKYQFEVTRKDQEGEYQCKVKRTTKPGCPAYECLSRIGHLKINSKPNVNKAQDKVALLIGTRTYFTNRTSLGGVSNDLSKMDQALQKLGFKVISMVDLTLEEMQEAVRIFCELLQDDLDEDTEDGIYALVYFAGHGFVNDGKHYIIPVDAREGLQTSTCLCMEDVERQIQKGCTGDSNNGIRRRRPPKLLCMILDSCRCSIQHVNSAPTTSSQPAPEVHGNTVKFFAASHGESAFEREGAMGVFTEEFLKVIENKVSVNNLWRDFMKAFKEYDPELKAQGKSMHPQMQSNLQDLERSLMDPVDYSKNRANFRNKLYADLHRLPHVTHINVAGGLALIIVRYVRKFSNVMNVMMEVQQQSATYRITDLCIDESKLPPEFISIKPRTQTTHQGNIEYVFTLNNLHRLQVELEPLLKIGIASTLQRYPTNIVPVAVSLKFGTPLMAALRQRSMRLAQWDKDMPLRRDNEPTEHDEDTDSLQDSYS